MNFTVITSNIRFDNPDDNMNEWKNRKSLLAKILKSHSPLVIATQEGRKPQLKELEHLLQMNLIDTHRQWIKERMYPCLFLDSSLISLESGDIWLSETPNIAGTKSFESMFPRLCTWTRLKNPEIYIANMHLDHKEESTRVMQIEVFIQEFKKIYKNNLPCIIMGDFNTDPNSQVRKILQNSFLNLKDPWVNFYSREKSSHHAFSGKDIGSRIDWILSSPELTCSNLQMETRNEHPIYPSDHYPIVASFQV